MFPCVLIVTRMCTYRLSSCLCWLLARRVFVCPAAVC